MAERFQKPLGHVPSLAKARAAKASSFWLANASHASRPFAFWGGWATKVLWSVCLPLLLLFSEIFIRPFYQLKGAATPLLTPLERSVSAGSRYPVWERSPDNGPAGPRPEEPNCSPPGGQLLPVRA